MSTVEQHLQDELPGDTSESIGEPRLMYFPANRTTEIVHQIRRFQKPVSQAGRRCGEVYIKNSRFTSSREPVFPGFSGAVHQIGST